MATIVFSRAPRWQEWQTVGRSFLRRRQRAWPGRHTGFRTDRRGWNLGKFYDFPAPVLAENPL